MARSHSFNSPCPVAEDLLSSLHVSAQRGGQAQDVLPPDVLPLLLHPAPRQNWGQIMDYRPAFAFPVLAPGDVPFLLVNSAMHDSQDTVWLYFIMHGYIFIGRAFPHYPTQELSPLYCESWFSLFLFLTIENLPNWLLWLSGLSAGLRTKESLVQFPVRAHAWVVGQVPGRGHARGNHTQ